MAWIESHQSLGEHPKTKKLCRVLGISKPEAVGHLHMLWWWAMDYAQDGDLSRYEPLDIAIGAEWHGDESTFVDALVTAGFLDRENGVRIHDWHDYAGKLIERRARNAQRMRDARADYDAGTNGDRATHVQRTQRARVQLPNQTIPNQTIPTEPEHNVASAPEFPDDFLDFWKQYPSGNGSKSKTYQQWRKVKGEHPAIMAGLALWNSSERWQKGFVKTAELWVRDRLWENPPPSPQNGIDTMDDWLKNGALAPELRR